MNTAYQSTMQELRAEKLARAYDPVRYALAAGFVPDGWQAKFLRSKSKARMLNNSRQSGKSTVVAVGVLHRAIYYPGSLILLLSPGERQSIELMRKVAETLEQSQDAPRLITEGQLTLEFANGSRIIALPGSDATVRGYSAVDILVVDEASRVADTLFFAIEPMLAVSGGELWTLSSPYGTRGWWYNQYAQQKEVEKRGGKGRWEYYEVPATKCPRISAEFLADQRIAMGDWWWKQEYMCVFLDARSAAFASVDIDAAFDEEALPWLLEPMSATVIGGQGQDLWTP